MEGGMNEWTCKQNPEHLTWTKSYTLGFTQAPALLKNKTFTYLPSSDFIFSPYDFTQHCVAASYFLS